jgi:hypothetical protein
MRRRRFLLAVGACVGLRHAGAQGGSRRRTHPKLLADLALRRRVPAIYTARDFAEAGGLLAYGSDGHAVDRRAAEYVHRILQGARPGDLPVEQVASFELVVNLKTARARVSGSRSGCAGGSANRLARIRADAQRGVSLSSSCFSSPFWYISRMMSQPPTNSPST